MRGRYYSLPRRLTYQEEVIRIDWNDVSVDDSTWWWIPESLSIHSLEKSLVDPFVHQDYHHLNGFWISTRVFNRCLYLRELVHQNGFTLAVTNPISVDNHVHREATIFLLKLNEGLPSNRLQPIWKFLSLVLESSRRPKSSGPLIETPTEGKHWLIAISNLMEDINATDHSGLIKVRQVWNCPRLTPNFRAYLD